MGPIASILALTKKKKMKFNHEFIFNGAMQLPLKKRKRQTKYKLNKQT